MKKILVFITLFVVNLILMGNVKAYNIYKSYEVGEQVQVAGENYYVIADSDSGLDYVTLLKEEPLLYSEIKPLIQSTEIATQIEKDNQDNTSYLIMAYLYSDTCVSADQTGCTTDYNLSSIKQVIDIWVDNTFKNNELKEVEGHKARLITVEELRDNLGYNFRDILPSGLGYWPSGPTPSWVFNIEYDYYTMSPIEDSTDAIWYVSQDGSVTGHTVRSTAWSVRPVINLEKDPIGSNEDDVIANNQENKDNSNTVNVANTLLRKSMITVIIGLVIIGIGVTIYIIVMKKKK